jgi:hypothetical protein
MVRRSPDAARRRRGPFEKTNKPPQDDRARARERNRFARPCRCPPGRCGLHADVDRLSPVDVSVARSSSRRARADDLDSKPLQEK